MRIPDHLDLHQLGKLENRLFERGDLQAVLALRREMVRRYPDQLRLRLHLADAYRLVGEDGKALAVARELHLLEPDDLETQHLILDLLYARGKTEEDFDWVSPPRVLHLDEELREHCYEILVERKVISTFELMVEHWMGIYCCFDEEELASFLEEDPRFEVHRPQWDPPIVLLEGELREGDPVPFGVRTGSGEP